MNERQLTRWLDEFKELGADKVRQGMIVGRWEKDKRSAARQWLEQLDARRFQADRPVGSAPKTFFMKRRSTWWWIYLVGGLALAMGAARLLRMLR